jgi:hypothetical protein
MLKVIQRFGKHCSCYLQELQPGKPKDKNKVVFSSGVISSKMSSLSYEFLFLLM